MSNMCLYNMIDFVPQTFHSLGLLALCLGELQQESKEPLIKSNHTKVHAAHMTEHLLDGLGGSEGRSYLHI